MQIGAATMENSMEGHQKIKNGLASWPSDPTSGSVSEETQNNHPMFFAVLFSIGKIWKQLKCPSIDEWIKMQWYTHTMEYYLVIKNEMLPFATAWVDLEGIMLSEISQTEKHK